MHDLPSPTLPLRELGWPAPKRARVPTPTQLPSAFPAGLLAGDALQVAWARDEDDVRDAQRLRHRVFVGEMGARLETPPGTPDGIDADRYDPYCEHLLVRRRGLNSERGERGETVGTYRVLTPAAALRAGGLYSETEFDMGRLKPLRPRMVELGRSCVHPQHRAGGVILALWGALAGFMVRNGLETMVGCASVGMHDGGGLAAGLWRQLSTTHLAAPEWRVVPHLPLPVDALQSPPHVEAPALIKGYLRCGSLVLGAPAWDPQFNTADLPLMMRIDDLSPRYRQHFFGS